MPPETKQVISSLEQMTCENCVYSAHSRLLCDLECRNPDGSFTRIEIGFFCSKGKWLCNDSIYISEIESETKPWVTDYDDCYYLFGRGKRPNHSTSTKQAG